MRKIFTDKEKEKIVRSLKQAIESSAFKAHETWGEVIEDRGSQITFSALGQQAPIEEKEKWDPDFTKRKKMKALPRRVLSPSFPCDWAARHPLTSPSLASTKPTGLENSETPLALQFRR